MNRIQKIAWVFVISTSGAFAVSLIAAGIFYSYVGMPRALYGFCFMGLTGLGGLAPLLAKKDTGPVAVDERDQLFNRRAVVAGFATAYAVMGAGCMISVNVMAMVLIGGVTLFVLVQHAATFIQYGRGGDNGRN